MYLIIGLIYIAVVLSKYTKLEVNSNYVLQIVLQNRKYPLGGGGST